MRIEWKKSHSGDVNMSNKIDTCLIMQTLFLIRIPSERKKNNIK